MILPQYDPSYDPVEHLEAMKVRLVRHTLHGHNALWVPERKLVIVDRGLRSDLTRPTLSHECSHVENCDIGGHHPKLELRANLHSALRLINPIAWNELTPHTSCYDTLCLELGITRRQFLAYVDYRKGLQKSGAVRIGDTVYGDSKMGASQWSMKVSA
ncbi:hypothetical protein G7068_11820 [Leucobacter viscericola]|uniref:IrrE N-terminal-like domain-containing protein n=1 Tax=Leucobacter viscericola TaxID=2714935 RepID=A0A6G7XH42_9MICO|nr:hypothetical protein [Leucobacter viscericola]QIK63796.1 hypothetical protein G7068_11820 [Leucobacter viscericola]